MKVRCYMIRDSLLTLTSTLKLYTSTITAGDIVLGVEQIRLHQRNKSEAKRCPLKHATRLFYGDSRMITT